MQMLNDLLEYKDLKIYQDTDFFHFSLDSILLPNFVTLNPRCQSILDIGTGNAVIPLILTTKTKAKICGVEIQKTSYDLAEKSVKLNKLSNQISIVLDDIKHYAEIQESDIYDVITCNPPYFPISDCSRINSLNGKALARHELSLQLEDILKISRKLLKNNGIFAMVHRPDRLVEILLCMKNYNIEPKKIQLIYPKVGKEANILLIEGRKNGKPGLKILDPIYAHNQNGSYTEQIMKYFKEE